MSTCTPLVYDMNGPGSMNTPGPIVVHVYVYTELSVEDRKLFHQDYTTHLGPNCPTWLILSCPNGSAWIVLNEKLKAAAVRAGYEEGPYSKMQLFSHVDFTHHRMCQ